MAQASRSKAHKKITVVFPVSTFGAIDLFPGWLAATKGLIVVQVKISGELQYIGFRIFSDGFISTHLSSGHSHLPTLVVFILLKISDLPAHCSRARVHYPLVERYSGLNACTTPRYGFIAPETYFPTVFVLSENSVTVLTEADFHSLHSCVNVLLLLAVVAHPAMSTRTCAVVPRLRSRLVGGFISRPWSSTIAPLFPFIVRIPTMLAYEAASIFESILLLAKGMFDYTTLADRHGAI